MIRYFISDNVLLCFVQVMVNHVCVKSFLCTCVLGNLILKMNKILKFLYLLQLISELCLNHLSILGMRNY